MDSYVDWLAIKILSVSIFSWNSDTEMPTNGLHVQGTTTTKITGMLKIDTIYVIQYIDWLSPSLSRDPRMYLNEKTKPWIVNFSNYKKGLVFYIITAIICVTECKASIHDAHIQVRTWTRFLVGKWNQQQSDN